jgi:hypothetical protein
VRFVVMRKKGVVVRGFRGCDGFLDLLWCEQQAIGVWILFLWPFPMDGEVLAQLLTMLICRGLAWFRCCFGYECLFSIGV